jgi:hypothetical protein
MYTGLEPINSIDPSGLSDLNLFSPSDGLFTANEALDIPGVYTITGHGSSQGLSDRRAGDRLIATAEGLLKEMKGYNVGSGEPVFIGSCNVGKGPLPQELANLINAPVYAATGYYFSPTTKPKNGGEPYRPGDEVRMRVNANNQDTGDAGSFDAFYPNEQPTDTSPPGRLASVTVDPQRETASIRVYRVTGRIDSQLLDEEAKKKREDKR